VHFSLPRRWLAALVAAVVVLLSVGAYLSLPRAYLLMATTTSTQDTGLLSYLLPEFSRDSGVEVRYTAVGTGQALDAGRRGDVDVVMVHSPPLEQAFMDSGKGLCRNQLMYNRFVLVGPRSDPAGVSGATSIVDALGQIWNASARFASRADNSGTHNKELVLWASAGLTVSTFGAWYEKTGQGMGETLAIANQRDAYTLSDDGTWYSLEARLPFLVLAYGGDEPVLRNVYSVIPVNPANHTGILVDGAVAFARWLVAPRAQALIAAFSVNGRIIFTPDPIGAC